MALLFLKGVHFLLQRATIRPMPMLYIPAAVTSGMLAFLFAATFECNGPDFWAIHSTKCFNQVSHGVPRPPLRVLKRSLDSLLDCVWCLRYNHRSVFDDHPDSCHHGSADAERSEDEVAHCSRNTAPVSYNMSRPKQCSQLTCVLTVLSFVLSPVSHLSTVRTRHATIL